MNLIFWSLKYEVSSKWQSQCVSSREKYYTWALRFNRLFTMCQALCCFFHACLIFRTISEFYNVFASVTQLFNSKDTTQSLPRWAPPRCTLADPWPASLVETSRKLAYLRMQKAAAALFVSLSHVFLPFSLPDLHLLCDTAIHLKPTGRGGEWEELRSLKGGVFEMSQLCSFYYM